MALLLSEKLVRTASKVLHAMHKYIARTDFDIQARNITFHGKHWFLRQLLLRFWRV